MTDMNHLITKHLDIWTSAIEKKSSAGRGNGGAVSLYGIKKLRELILELAIRGKLVPQSDVDEPADVLLNHLHTQQADLFALGQIKKPKSVLKIVDTEIPFELPHGWKWCRISELGHDWGQKTPDNNFTYIDVGSINKELGLVSEPTVLTASEAPSRARKLVRSGTVVYSTVRPYLLNIAVITKDFDPEPIASTAFAIVHPFEGVSASYLYRYFRSPTFISYVEGCQTGIAYPAINDKQFFSSLIPLPPTAEQHRIVAKVDELMGLCDALESQAEDSLEAHQTLVETCLATLTNSQTPEDLIQNWTRIEANFDTLFTTEESIAVLRQLIFELAVRGKLVPQDGSEGNVAELIKQIFKERSKAIRSKNTRKQKPLPDIAEEEFPYVIPSTWSFIRLGDLTNYGITEKAEARDATDETWVLELEDVEKETSKLLQKVNFADRRFKSSKNRFQKCDVIYGKLRPYLDKVLIADMRGVCTTEMVPMRTYADVSPYFLRLVLKSPEFIRYADDSTHGMNLPRLGTEKARMAVLPLPPTAEQHRIVAKMDELMELCDKLSSKILKRQDIEKNLADTLVKVS